MNVFDIPPNTDCKSRLPPVLRHNPGPARTHLLARSQFPAHPQSPRNPQAAITIALNPRDRAISTDGQANRAHAAIDELYQNTQNAIAMITTLQLRNRELEHQIAGVGTQLHDVLHALHSICREERWLKRELEESRNAGRDVVKPEDGWDDQPQLKRADQSAENRGKGQ